MPEQKTEVVLVDGKWVKKVYVLDETKDVPLTQRDALEAKKATFSTIMSNWKVEKGVTQDVMNECIDQGVISQCNCEIAP